MGWRRWLFYGSLYVLLASPIVSVPRESATSSIANFAITVTTSSATGQVPLIAFDPSSPSIPASSAVGTVVTTVQATLPDGSPFTGTVSFGHPYGSDAGLFRLQAISPTAAQIVVASALPAGNSTQMVTLVASQPVP